LLTSKIVLVLLYISKSSKKLFYHLYTLFFVKVVASKVVCIGPEFQAVGLYSTCDGDVVL